MITGFACGVFDLYHPGHVLMLKECKEHCDYLVVGLNSCINLDSSKNAPIYTIDERFMILSSVKYIDEIVVYNSEEELSNILSHNKYNVRFLGNDYYNKIITAKDMIPRIIYLNRDHGYSTSNLRHKIVKLTKNYNE